MGNLRFGKLADRLAQERFVCIIGNSACQVNPLVFFVGGTGSRNCCHDPRVHLPKKIIFLYFVMSVTSFIL
jgi:hypothetical protein